MILPDQGARTRAWIAPCPDPRLRGNKIICVNMMHKEMLL